MRPSLFRFAYNQRFLGVVIVILLIVGLHRFRFLNQPYTHPEDWAIFTADAQLTSIFSGDFLQPIWITLFGIAPPITRWLSLLEVSLMLALLFRLGTDLFDREIGLVAIVIMGTSLITGFFTSLALPMAALLMAVLGMHLTWYRFLHHVSWVTGAFYLLFTLLAVIIYPFAGWILVAHLSLALFSRHTRSVPVLLGIALLETLVCAIILNHVDGFVVWRSFELTRLNINLTPIEVLQLALLVGIALAINLVYPDWGQPTQPTLPIFSRQNLAFVIISVAVILVSNTAFSTSYIRISYLLLALPLLALLASAALRLMSPLTRIGLVALIALPALTPFRNLTPPLPFQTVAKQTKNDYVIISAPYEWQHLPWMAYLTNEQRWHLIPTNAYQTFPITSAHVETQANAAAMERMMNFVGEASQVWWITVGNTSFANLFELRLREHYVLLHEDKWTHLTPANEDYGGWKQYVQIPDKLSDVFLFGENLRLQAWSLMDSVEVHPCQRITVRSWWKLREQENNVYTLTLALSDNQGQGITHVDKWIANNKTIYWAAGQPYLDERTLTIPCDTPVDDYSLVIGTYTLSDDGRLTDQPITLPDGRPIGNRAYLTTLFVRP